MRIFKTRDFARFARKEDIADALLCDAIARAERGLVDAALGGGIIKQRVPRKGRGRSGGFRTLIAYRQSQRAVFLHGFSKNTQGNLEENEIEALKTAATAIFKLDAATINKALTDGKWLEVNCDGEDIQV